jgi:hypothetical protein
MQTHVLDAIDDRQLRLLVAWVPILPEDSSGPGELNLALVPDERATHYWDGTRSLPPLFAPIIGLPEGMPAWDVYLAYDRGAYWRDEPPAPAFWQHQLGAEPDAPVLDGATFAHGVRRLLEQGDV